MFNGSLKGSIVALVTPFKDNILDINSLRQLVQWHILNGTDGIVVNGSTGEGSLLSIEEQESALIHVLEEVQGKIPVIACSAANSTQETILRTQKAYELGASAALITTPAYVKPTQEGLFLHFSHIAKATPLPIILYNVPSRTACDLLPETIGRLSEFLNIIGVKEATGQLERVNAIHQAVKNVSSRTLALLSGDDESACDFINQGGQGVISVTANVAPALMHAMCESALAGDETAAQIITEKLLPLHRSLFLESNPIPVKWALSRMGKISDTLRLPLTSLSIKYQALLENALKTAECI